ncbi:MAG TPA: hypothetical protein VK034_09155, partial [Enhygromyxa sp.]|nr:hypothetical protein [Enhygromyxa sp.]
MRWGLQSMLITLALSPVLGCGAPAELVELRLFPCDVGDLDPRSVAVELTGFDDQGEIVETFEVTFDGITASVFD